jgi:hypothetical protein
MFAHKITGADTRFPTLKICPECGKGAVTWAYPQCEYCTRASVTEVTEIDLVVLMEQPVVAISAALSTIAAANDPELIRVAVDTLQRSCEVEVRHLAQVCRDIFDRLRDGGQHEDLADQLIFAGVYASGKLLEAVSHFA